MTALHPFPGDPSRLFEPTLDEALRRVDAIEPGRYARTRNALDGAVTRLSPYVTHGFIDIPGVIARLSRRHALTTDDKLVFELAWREYFQHVWRHLDEGVFEDRRPPPASCYGEVLPDDVRAARTGVPVVDHAVRTLYATGYLHNHARMWLASYVVHLRKTHWRVGADWMYRHLLDGDLASNTLSWQWVAGTLTGKPYLFNADNVARYAPAWASPGTCIDAPYEVLEARAVQAADCGPERGAPAAGVDEPWMGAVPDVDLWPGPQADEVEVLHPWSLGEPSGRCRVGWIEPAFHRRFPWSEARWRFVLTRMRALCTTLVVGDGPALRARFPHARLNVLDTMNPFYRDAIRRAGMMARAPARQFGDPDRLQPSFSRFWQTVAPSAELSRPWHR
ncbi:FAD-binding domain-containing protein [Methyloversatilis thermotolerans]|uniref:FAD-binding domain-containing protein n=1 Tax=Methyloversatilis thermotolerans TaxID=1346290 RepID=UPI001E63797B|nr:FAD-binding domain-containing protein [Methyloversatilis thermotolerans]